ncbi:MAG TPA: glycosyltransferase family 4 protein [Candidatus Paceibacterota bacterium]|mgnify:CR=1 FL=1|nr:glycosyltransferase family 4 protein [Candidatus Paceibacterota bacterium]
MKLLVITQKVDKNDPILGFFHRWVEEFAKHVEQVTVICLEKGEYNLPGIKVLSLGKEEVRSRLKYIWRFYKYLWQERNNYDTVFVHMNQEYVLLAGLWWRVTGKKVTMWRNHHAGNRLADLAVLFCHKVFCTSRFSYTAKFKNNILMPVGINLEIFNLVDEKLEQRKRKVLFLARLSPVKKPNVLMAALRRLADWDVDFIANFYGDNLPSDHDWAEALKQDVAGSSLAKYVSFHAGVPNYQTPDIYRSHEVFVNLSSSGMYDKTIFEAMACGCLVLVCNQNLVGKIDDRLIFKEDDFVGLAQKLKELLILDSTEKNRLLCMLQKYVAENHSLELLAKKLTTYLKELNKD